MKKGKQTKLSTKILLGLLAAGMTFGMTGTAQAEEPTNVGNIENHQVTTFWLPSTTDVKCFFTNTNYPNGIVFGNITNNSLIPNDPDSSTISGRAYAGGVYLQGGDNSVPLNATFEGSTISGNKAQSTLEVYGGAMEVKGTNAVFNDVVITNNSAVATGENSFAIGGAIASSRRGSGTSYSPTHLTFNVTKDAAFTGNTVSTAGDANKMYNTGDSIVSTSGGFLFMETGSDAAFNVGEGATLTIGEEGAVTGDTDTIASGIPTTAEANRDANIYDPFITKTGAGTLTINSNLDKFYGDFTVEEGTVNLNADLYMGSTYTVNGGTLNMKDVTIETLYDKIEDTGITVTLDRENETITPAARPKDGSTVTAGKEDTVGILDTASGTIVNAEDVTVKDGGKIQTALGALNFDSLTVSGKDSEVIASGETTIKGDFSASDGASVIANDLSVSGAITVSDGADVTIGGSWLVVGQTTVDETSKLHLSVDAGLVKDAVVQADGLLDVSGVLTADGATINALNATIGDEDGGEVTAENGSTVTLGGDDLTLSAIHVVDADSQVILQSGTLGVDDMSTDITGEGKVTITEDAVLQTKAAQVFTNTSTTEFSAQGNDFSDAAKAKINFEGGTLALEDNYTPAYLSDVKSTLEKSAENTTLFMSGTLMAEGTGQNRISANDAGNLGENITLDQVTATSSSDVVIGADEGEIDGFSVGTLALSGDAKSVTVSDGKTLTLGGTTTSDVITATAGTPTINLTNDGTLNIGNDFVENNHELNVGADIHAEDSTIYTNGTTTITGAVSLADSGLSSETGSLTLEKALTTSGETGIAGTVTAEKGITSTEEGTIVNVGTEDKTAEVTSLADIDVGETGTVVVNEGSILNAGNESTETMTITGNLAADGGNINTYGTASVSGTTSLGDGALLAAKTGTLAVNDMAVSGTSNVTGAVTTGGIEADDEAVDEDTTYLIVGDSDTTTTDTLTTTKDINLADGAVIVRSDATLNVGTADTAKDTPLNVNTTLIASNGTIKTYGKATAGDIALADSTLSAAKDSTLTMEEMGVSGTSTILGDVTSTDGITALDDNPANITVGSDTNNSSSLTSGKDIDLNGGTLKAVNAANLYIGTQESAASGETLTVNADIDSTNGIVSTIGNTVVTGSVSMNGTDLESTSGTLQIAKDVTATGDSLNFISGDVNIAGTLSTDGDDTVVEVGSTDTKSTVVIGTVAMNGGVLSFDPAYSGGGQTDGDEYAIGALAYNNPPEVVTGGTLVVGNNTTVTIGSTDTTTAETVFASSKLEWNDSTDGILSALYLPNTLQLIDSTGNTKYSVNIASDAKAESIDGGTFQMGKNSLLMVEGDQITDTAAVNNVETTVIDSAAKIYIHDAEDGTTYKLLSAVPAIEAGEGTVETAEGNVQSGNDLYAEANAAASENISTNNKLVKFVGAADNSTTLFAVTAETQKVSDAYKDEGLIAPNTADALQASGNENAKDFVNSAANEDNNKTTASQVNAYNSQAALTELAGVQHGLYAADNLFDDSVMGHLTGLHTSDQDKDLWAHYIHSKEDIRGLGLANMGASYDAQFNGFVVGSDFYTKGNATVGAAVTYVNGNIDGNSLAAHTENDADYYGLAFYGRVEQGPMTYLGDISYLHGSNDLTQKNTGKTITGSTDSDAYSIGVRAERGIAAGQGTVTPFAGIRYLHLGTDAYTDSLGVRHDSDDANLWLLPLGVRYSADLQNGGWTVRPMAEAGYVWTFGDRDGTDKVGLNGAGDAFGFNIADAGSWYGRLGVEAAKGNMTYGVAYQYQHGTSVKSNTFGVKVGYRF